MEKATPYATDDLKVAVNICSMAVKISTLRSKNLVLLMNLSDYYESVPQIPIEFYD